MRKPIPCALSFHALKIRDTHNAILAMENKPYTTYCDKCRAVKHRNNDPIRSFIVWVSCGTGFTAILFKATSSLMHIVL